MDVAVDVVAMTGATKLSVVAVTGATLSKRCVVALTWRYFLFFSLPRFPTSKRDVPALANVSSRAGWGNTPYPTVPMHTGKRNSVLNCTRRFLATLLSSPLAKFFASNLRTSPRPIIFDPLDPLGLLILCLHK
jgi:hypothetical protein